MRRAAALLLAALAGACGGYERPAEVRVFAASSLAEVMQTIAADFEKETNAKVKLNLAASSVLAKQIVEGAACDVFLSADVDWADFVQKAGFGEPGTSIELLGNSLVVVFRKGGTPRNPKAPRSRDPSVGWTSWEAPLLEPGSRVALGDPSHVPAGRYAKAALEGLKLWDQVEKRVIPCESVRAALALVERGEADAGIVYATDAKASKADLESVPLPAVAGVDIRYPVLGVKGLGSPGRSFLRFLWTERAKDAFRKTGFVVRPLSFTPR